MRLRRVVDPRLLAAAFAPEDDGEDAGFAGGEDGGHRERGFAIQQADGGAGEGADDVLQQAEHGGGAAGFSAEGRHRGGGGVGEDQPERGDADA